MEFNSLPGQPEVSSTASAATVSTPNSIAVGASPTNCQKPTKTPENMMPNDAGTTKSFFRPRRRKDYDMGAVMWEMGLVGGVAQGAALLF